MNAIRTAQQRGQTTLALSAKLLIASSLATVIGFTAICASVMLDMRRGEEELARQTWRTSHPRSTPKSAATSNSMTCRARGGEQHGDPEINQVNKPIRHLILFDHAATAKHFGAIQVFDAQGRLTIDASTLDPVPEDARRGVFQGSSRPARRGLFISRPMLHHGAYAIVLSRRVTGADASFSRGRGLDPLQLFHDLFSRLHLGPDDTITVLRRDGTVIMRTPFDLDVIGKNLSYLPA